MAQFINKKANKVKTILGATMLFMVPLLSLPVFAEYVTDKIVIEVRSQRLSQGVVLKTLPSGSVVEVLMNDGGYTRIRTQDNVTGWVQSQFLTKEKPAQTAYLEQLTKTKTLEAKLKVVQAEGGGDGVDIAEIEELRKRAADAGWMRVELKKARDRVAEIENKLNNSGQTTSISDKELTELTNKNKELERRLAAAMEFNEQQQGSITDSAGNSSEHTTQNSDNQSWMVSIEWFLGSIIVALIIGLAVGMIWLDKRIRQRHGGFRIY